jgi:hypothetical protein
VITDRYVDDATGRPEWAEEARLYAHYGLEYGPATSDAASSGAGSEFIAPATDKVEEGAPRRLRKHAPAD